MAPPAPRDPNAHRIPNGKSYTNLATALAVIGVILLFFDLGGGLSLLGSAGVAAMIGQMIGYLHVIEARLIALRRTLKD